MYSYNSFVCIWMLFKRSLTMVNRHGQLTTRALKQDDDTSNGSTPRKKLIIWKETCTKKLRFLTETQDLFIHIEETTRSIIHKLRSHHT